MGVDASKRLWGLVAIALVVVLLMVVLLREREGGSVARVSAKAGLQEEPRATLVEPRADAAKEVGSTAREETVKAEPEASRLVCLGRRDRQPIPGISVFAAGLRLCGPSRADGVLELVRGRSQAFTIWGEGWVPVRVRGFETTPQTMLLERADARLEVRILALDPDESIVRTLLQPHAFHVTGEAPWEPALVSTSQDRLAAGFVPPGVYDVYVWIARPQDAPRCLSATGIQVQGPEPVHLELDAARPPDVEPDS